MPASTTKTATKKRSRRSQKAPRPVQYTIAIDTWDWSFSFGVNKISSFSDPYNDFRHLVITGTLKQPAMPKVTSVSVTLMPDMRFNESARQNDKPQHVGSINARGSEFDALLSIPADVLPSIIAALHAGQIRFVAMEGEKLRYGEGLVTRFSLDRTADDLDVA